MTTPTDGQQAQVRIANAELQASIAAIGRVLLCHPSRWLEVARAHSLAQAAALDPDADTRMRGEATVRGGYRVENGVAIVPLMGSLIARGAFFGASHVTSYEGFRSEMRRAAADEKVRAIVLAVDSPGGMVSGIDAAAASIRAAREVKPVTASVEGMAASAAYWLASQTGDIAISSLSQVGSIGVVALHLDISKALADFGIAPTLIYSGARKVDGNPFEALPQEVRADFQADVDRLRLEFSRAVAAGRPQIKSDEAMATEARMFSGEKAVEANLADRVASLDEVIATAGAGSRTLHTVRSPTMTTQNIVPAAITDADVTAATATARTEAAKAERERFSTILADEKVKGKERAAFDLAIKSPSMPAADVIAFVDANVTLATVSATPAASLASRVDPNGGAGGGHTTGGTEAEVVAAKAAWGAKVDAVNKRISN